MFLIEVDCARFLIFHMIVYLRGAYNSILYSYESSLGLGG